MQHHSAQIQNGMNPSYMMESMKSNLMTMMMFQQMNGGGSGGSSHPRQDIFGMIYMFLVTNLIEHGFKYLPLLFMFIQKYYMDRFSSVQRNLANSTVDLTDNKVKKKTSSITVTISVNSPDNTLGAAILDYITNNKNTTHVSYIRENFILNQKDVISIESEIFAKMTESTSDSAVLSGQSMNSGSNGSTNSGGPAIVQIIEVYSFTKTMDELRDFLDNIKQRYIIAIKNKLGNKRYFFNMHNLAAPMDINKTKDYSRLPPFMTFTMKQFQTNRKFSNLFGEDIDVIRNRVNFFCNNRKWYDEKGIPYTLGLLLSGKPGTGKTSTIKCLANETNRHIFNINLNNDISKRQLENLFFNEEVTVLNQNTGQMETFNIPLDSRCFVFEDIDAQGDLVRDREITLAKTEAKKQEHKEKESELAEPDKHALDLSFLLNLLDGVLENPGRIVIMTSNYPETLDSALIRPGRIDIIAKFRNCTVETMVRMIEFFYDIKLTPADLDKIGSVRSEILTPAELSKVMFENFHDYMATIQHLVELSKPPLVASQSVTDITVLEDDGDELDEEIHASGMVYSSSSLTDHSETTQESENQSDIQDPEPLKTHEAEEEARKKSMQHNIGYENNIQYKKGEMRHPAVSYEKKQQYMNIIEESYCQKYLKKFEIKQGVRYLFIQKLNYHIFHTPEFKKYASKRQYIEETHPNLLFRDSNNGWDMTIMNPTVVYGELLEHKKDFERLISKLCFKIESIVDELNLRGDDVLDTVQPSSQNLWGQIDGVHDYAIYG